MTAETGAGFEGVRRRWGRRTVVATVASLLLYYYRFVQPSRRNKPHKLSRPTDRFSCENARDLISTHMYTGL